ncbi:MAG: segregation/condensation protein A [Thermoleophilaceae bacterium]|nr:segregation/condensation protein A [Thermoleophilaceae bacterium]
MESSWTTLNDADARDEALASAVTIEEIEAAEIEASAGEPAHVVALTDGTPRFDALELDLEVFHGPFDLLLELVMREEIDLLEVDLAQIVLGYVELLESRGEIELEPVTEFVVLVAALLELKSRMMLPREETDGVFDLEFDAEEAAEELLSRMLEYHRYNKLAGWLRERYHAEQPFHYRSAPLPKELRTVSHENLSKVYNPEKLSSAIGDLLRVPEQMSIPHMRLHRATLQDRLTRLRTMLKRATHFNFDDAVEGEDRLTEALTVWALLELYKLGEADWEQEENFGPIEVYARSAA